MKKLLLPTLLLLGYFCSAQTYLPNNGELPKEGTYTRIGPMEIWMANIPEAGVKVLNPEDGAGYYGYLEFGPNYKAYKIYKKGTGLLVSSLGTSEGSFVKSETDQFFKTTYNWSGNTPTFKIKLEITGCKVRVLCSPKVYFTEHHFDSKGTLTSYLTMYYSYEEKNN